MKSQNVKNRSSKGSKKAGGPTPAFFMPAYFFLLSSHHFKMMSIEGASRLVHNVKNISSTRITSFRWRWFYYSTDVSFMMRRVCILSFDLRKKLSWRSSFHDTIQIIKNRFSTGSEKQVLQHLLFFICLYLSDRRRPNPGNRADGKQIKKGSFRSLFLSVFEI